MKTIAPIAAVIGLAALFALNEAGAQAVEPAMPDERPGAGALRGLENPPSGNPASELGAPPLRRGGTAGDAPERKTGPKEDDQGTGILDDEDPGRGVPGEDDMGNEPGTDTGDPPFSDR